MVTDCDCDSNLYEVFLRPYFEASQSTTSTQRWLIVIVTVIYTRCSYVHTLQSVNDSYTAVTDCDCDSNLYEVFLRPYFEASQRLVHSGDLVSVSAAMRTAEFKVTNVSPDPYCYVAETTLVVCDNKLIKRAVSNNLFIPADLTEMFY